MDLWVFWESVVRGCGVCFQVGFEVCDFLISFGGDIGFVGW